MTPQPIVLGMTVCEKVIVEEGTKNLTLVSCFTALRISEFPSPPQRFVLFAALKDGLGHGRIDIVATRLDGDHVIYEQQAPIYFPDRLQEVRLMFRVNDCSFPAPGRYQFAVLLDGEWLAQRELRVIQR